MLEQVCGVSSPLSPVRGEEGATEWARLTLHPENRVKGQVYGSLDWVKGHVLDFLKHNGCTIS